MSDGGQRKTGWGRGLGGRRQGKMRPWERDEVEERVAGRRNQSLCNLLGDKQQTKGRKEGLGWGEERGNILLCQEKPVPDKRTSMEAILVHK